MPRIIPPPVDLDRTFLTIRPDEPIRSDGVDDSWFSRRSALTWSDLLERPRVVILAEANSGKTFEFERQVELLKIQSKSAFFAPIEQLAEKNLASVLGMQEAKRFEDWQSSGQPGWFFLDSIDEAKLTHRNLELALKQFARDLESGYQNARILISCRGTDWAGEGDLKRISDALPAPRIISPVLDPEEALLARVNKREASEAAAEQPPPYSVVAMIALSAEQRRRMLDGMQCVDADGFELALSRQGLHELANRPGDLLVLARYWTTKGRLGSLTEMMEFSIAARIADRRDRPGASILTDRKAREGAERVAAAMVLGRAVTVKTDPFAFGSGISLAAILEDWTPAEQDALIRRGIFAAATYGQARFNHRSVMEYLAAQWFANALRRGCPVSRVMAVCTARPFGVDTIPPSLRPVTAWLAPHCKPLRRYISEHTPLTLILHADPTALDVGERAALLRRYAELQKTGRLRHEYADQHALWMFADPALAKTIGDVWPEADDNFRFELLRLVEQGGLSACANLAADTVLDENSGPYSRILAARVLAKFGKAGALRRLASAMLASPDKFSPRLGPDLALALFPKMLTVASLLSLIARSPPARRYQVEGFGYAMASLYAACTSRSQKRQFIDGIATLCRLPPFEESWQPVSKRHASIARRMEELLAAALADISTLGVWPGIVNLVWVAQVADLDSDRDRQSEIRSAVRSNIKLNKAVFWFGVDRMIEQDREADPVRLWSWQRLERRYWSIEEEDRSWLEDAATKAKSVVRRRIAFAALIDLAGATAAPADAFSDLRNRFGGDPILMSDLRLYLKPRKVLPGELKRLRRTKAQEAALAKAREIRHRDWRELRRTLVANPGQLQDKALFLKWPDYVPLVSVTKWLANGEERDRSKAVLNYQDIAVAFSPEVAEAYRRGMMRFWRTAKPLPPTISPEGRTTPWSSLLSMAGLALEAATTPSWTETLDSAEARHAIRHVFISGQDFPDWLDALLVAFPHVVEPYLLKELKREWELERPGHTPLLYRAGTTLPMTRGVQSAFLRMAKAGLPLPSERFDEVRKMLRRLTLSAAQRRSLLRVAEQRMQLCLSDENWGGSIGVILILFELDWAVAIAGLVRLLEAQPQNLTQERAEDAFGALFGMSRGRVWGLRQLPEDALAALLRLAYKYVRPEDDVHHEGSYSPDRRDDAQTARNELLGALMNKGGERSYLLMRQLLADEAFGASTSRLHRLAHEMAEAASEGGAWDEATVLRFESDFTEPVTSGERLFALVCELIDDIARTLQSEDVSARELLLTARDEHAVQSWLAHELQTLARGRFTVPIEKEAPGRERLDITVVSNSAELEVAVEMKHGGKGWTLPRLRASLSRQLGERYLKPERRRHGILVISNHSARRWDDDAGGRIGFADLIATLQRQAEGLVANRFGPIHVAVRGLDAVLPDERASANRRRKLQGPT